MKVLPLQHFNGLVQEVHKVFIPNVPLEQVHWSAGKIQFQKLVSRENLALRITSSFDLKNPSSACVFIRNIFRRGSPEGFWAVQPWHHCWALRYLFSIAIIILLNFYSILFYSIAFLTFCIYILLNFSPLFWIQSFSTPSV